jgi:hypothetical protein
MRVGAYLVRVQTDRHSPEPHMGAGVRFLNGSGVRDFFLSRMVGGYGSMGGGTRRVTGRG